MQTSTVIIRALFLGTITRKQIVAEISVAILNGFALSLICGLGVWFFYGKISLGLVFALSLLITMFVAGFVGVMIPIGLKKLKIDPAVASSVFLTAATDVAGFLTLLILGTAFLM
jgi:magnesium transporter